MSKQLRSLLVKFPSLKLRSGLKCARRVRGHLVMSFTIPRSCLSHIRVSELHHTAAVTVSCGTHSSITFDFLSTMCQCLKGFFPCSPHSSRTLVPALHSQGIWPSLSGCCLQLCRFIPIFSCEHFYSWLVMWRPTLDLSKVRRCNTRSVLLCGTVWN